MKEFKKLTSVLLSLATAAAMMLPLGLNASAAVINYKWTMDNSSSNAEEIIGWMGYRGRTNYSVDTAVHTDGSWYSIKLENTDYNRTYVERTYNVEPNTTYKFSAMVKYSGYRLDPNEKNKTSGAAIGEPNSYNGEKWVASNDNSGVTNSNEWTLMEYIFTTGKDEKTHNLALLNGNAYTGNCKGTAWFSDVKLEKAEMTNKWDILAVIFKNIDATIPLNGKTIRFQNTLSQSKIDDINKYALDTLPSVFKELSDNKLNINSIDRYVENVTLTEKDLTPRSYQDAAKTIPSGYCTAPNKSELIGKTLDKYLARKNYNQILIFVPLSSKDVNIKGSWWGLGGTKYKYVNFAQITNSYDNAFKNDHDFQGAVCFHEITHGMERASRAINGDKTPSLDNDRAVYQEKYGLTAKEWYSGYWNATLPDGRGLDPSAFYRPNGKYTLVDGDMSTGAGITPGSDSVTPPAPKTFRAETVDDVNIKFSWDAVPGADGVEYVRFKAADHKEMAREPSSYAADRTSATWGPFTKGKPFYFGLRAKYTQNGKTVYSDWTYLTYTIGGGADGDVNGDGTLNVNDVVALIGMILNGSVTGHAYEAIGEAKGTALNVNHAILLLQKCLTL